MTELTTYAIPQTPLHGRSTFRRNTILLVAYFDPIGLMTIRENVAAWVKASAYDFEVINLWKCGFSPLRIPAHIDLNDYAGVMIHPAVCYFPTNLVSLDTDLVTKFSDYDGLKILVKQDEHFRTHEFGAFIKDSAFDILVTCVPPHELEKAYTAEALEGVRVVQQLTAFVSENMRKSKRRSYDRRPIDISYRGSIQPLICGRLGFEKRAIGQAVRGPAEAAGLATDISSRWEDRINGEAWMQFLSSSKAVLGVESGSNLFDFDGSVTQWCDKFAAENADMDPGSEDYYLKANAEYLHKFEDNIDYAQISPRHFEAAAVGALQILYEGRYSDIFKPGRHYFSLKRDLSNLDEAFDLIRDEKAWSEMTTAAFEEIIQSDAYTYDRFVKAFDSAVRDKLDEKGIVIHSRASRTLPRGDVKKRALVAMYHDPDVDPRVTWMSESLEARGYEVVELGVHHDLTSPIALKAISETRVQIRSRLVPHTWPGLRLPQAGTDLPLPEYVLSLMAQCVFAPNSALEKRFGAVNPIKDTESFRHACWEMINGPSILLDVGRQLGDFDVVVGVDLHGAPLANALAAETGAVSVFDAHEYWPAARATTNWEFDFWSKIEQSLVAGLDLTSTVSKPLADIMSSEYARDYTVLPNCASLQAAKPLSDERKAGIDIPARTEDQVVFVFHGGLHRERPVEFLVNSWPQTDERAILWVRAIKSPLRDELIEMARANGLLDIRIFFPEPAAEDELIESARAADAGIIPYSPHNGLNYQHACPNKLSQYSAAGLPTLSTDLTFVRGMIEAEDIGRIYDTLNPADLAAHVQWFVDHPEERRAMGDRAKVFFETSYNWDQRAAPLLDAIDALVAQRAAPAQRRPLSELIAAQEADAIDRELQGAGPVYGWPNFAPAPPAPPVIMPEEPIEEAPVPEAEPVAVAEPKPEPEPVPEPEAEPAAEPTPAAVDHTPAPDPEPPVSGLRTIALSSLPFGTLVAELFRRITMQRR
jgi:glycosyltransferase involved in cell wall biosynthesis